jgi:hypothetical protein
MQVNRAETRRSRSCTKRAPFIDSIAALIGAPWPTKSPAARPDFETCVTRSTVLLPDPTAAEANEFVARRRVLAPPPEEGAMSEIGLPEKEAPPSAPMRAKTEEEWEQEKEEES